jgi:hypothetical protein
MYKLILSIVSPLAVVALVLAVSTPMQAVEPQEVVVKSGDARIVSGPPKPRAGRKVAWYAWEGMLDPSGRVQIYEYTRYGNGDVQAKVSPLIEEMPVESIPWEFEPQLAPADIQPPPCSLSVQSASIQATAATGQVHCEAAVPCVRVGAGDVPCHGISTTFYFYRLELGIWRPIAHSENSYYPGCQATAHPTTDATAPRAGYYMANWYGWDKVTNANLWSLSIQFGYAG